MNNYPNTLFRRNDDEQQTNHDAPDEHTFMFSIAAGRDAAGDAYCCGRNLSRFATGHPYGGDRSRRGVADLFLCTPSGWIVYVGFPGGRLRPLCGTN